jgi:hypothetical protein
MMNVFKTFNYNRKVMPFVSTYERLPLFLSDFPTFPTSDLLKQPVVRKTVEGFIAND